MVIREVCPRCKSPKYKKNGHIHNGKQNHQCKDCGRQFVDCFEQYLVSDETRGLIERLLLERLSFGGYAVRWRWDSNGYWALSSPGLRRCRIICNVQPISSNQDVMIQRLEVEADEMASFVQKKANKQWIWLAMDAKTRQIIGVPCRVIAAVKAPGSCGPMIPKAYRQHATFYTDQYVVYKGVIPAAQHHPIGKLARKTNHIERFNNTLRQRVSRLVRSALSFSKRLANHIGAIKYFICHYNLTES